MTYQWDEFRIQEEMHSIKQDEEWERLDRDREERESEEEC